MTFEKSIPVRYLIKRYCDGADFLKVLKAGHAMISVSDQDGLDRWDNHQDFSKAMHRVRARRENVPIVLGFFEAGIGEEISLFGDEHGHNTYDGDGDICYDYKQPDLPVCNLFAVANTPYYQWRDDKSPGHLVIGYGCKDLGYEVKAQFNPYRAFDIGWIDGMGEHVEYYDPPYYVRISMSCRHSYVLRIDPDTRLVTPLGVDLGEVLWDLNISDLRKGIQAVADAAVCESSCVGPNNDGD